MIKIDEPDAGCEEICEECPYKYTYADYDGAIGEYSMNNSCSSVENCTEFEALMKEHKNEN